MKIVYEKSACESVGVDPVKPESGTKLGIAIHTIGKTPIHGLRHNPENGTNGWYIWCGGEMGTEDDFFSPVHVEHVGEYIPEVQEYLDLPPGYRFLIDGNNYEDVWFDPDILKA
jgi:hypothetical protein